MPGVPPGETERGQPQTHREPLPLEPTEQPPSSRQSSSPPPSLSPSLLHNCPLTELPFSPTVAPLTCDSGPSGPGRMWLALWGVTLFCIVYLSLHIEGYSFGFGMLVAWATWAPARSLDQHASPPLYSGSGARRRRLAGRLPIGRLSVKGLSPLPIRL